MSIREGEPGRREALEIPVFPLPTIFFPHTFLPLRIFEPRYREMTEDALAGDGQIGIVLLQPGLASDDDSEPARVFKVGSVGEIVRHERQEDGRYRIILAGRARFRIREFLPFERAYRRALVELIPERMPTAERAAKLRTRLLRLFRLLTEQEEDPKVDLEALSKLDLPALVNTLCATLRLTQLKRQDLLRLNSYAQRADSVREILEEQASLRQFAQKFSHLRPEDASLN